MLVASGRQNLNLVRNILELEIGQLRYIYYILMIIRLEDASGEPYTASELSKLVNFIELFCYLVREKGGLDNIRASLQAFEMRHDGTIQREWLEGKFRLCRRLSQAQSKVVFFL